MEGAIESGCWQIYALDESIERYHGAPGPEAQQTARTYEHKLLDLYGHQKATNSRTLGCPWSEQCHCLYDVGSFIERSHGVAGSRLQQIA